MALTVLEILGAGFVYVLAACVAVWLGRARVHLETDEDQKAATADRTRED